MTTPQAGGSLPLHLRHLLQPHCRLSPGAFSTRVSADCLAVRTPECTVNICILLQSRCDESWCAWSSCMRSCTPRHRLGRENFAFPGEIRPLSVPFLLRTSGKGHSDSQSGSNNKIPNFNFQKSQLYCWIQPIPLSHMVLKGSRCVSWSGGLTRRNGKTNQMKTNSQRSLKSICVVTPISLREDKSYLTTWTLKRLG